MCGITIDSGRSQPSLASAINGSTMMIPSKKQHSKLHNTNNVTMKTSKSSPLLATDDDMIKCKYITKNSKLGDGNFSVVKECINVQTKETYAMKLVHKNLVKNKLQLIKREFGLLNALSVEIRHLENKNKNKNVSLDYFQGHHHILQLYDYFETEENIVLITQLCDQTDLYEKIIANNHLDLMKQVMPYTACLVSVLDFLHSQRVIHRDIKAENVLFRLHKKKNPDFNLSNQLPEQYDLSAHDLIVGDFGLATRINDPNSLSLKEYVGTISYISPEIVKCKSVASMSESDLDNIKPYGTAVDIWALGVLVYFMAFGYTPFDCETDEETLDCISKCDYYIDEDYSKRVEYKDFWNFIQCCFAIDPKKRRTAKQLRHHPFVDKFFDNRHSTATTGTSLLVERPDLGPRNHSFNTLRKLDSPERTESLMNLSWISPSLSSSSSSGTSASSGSTLSTRGSNYSYARTQQNHKDMLAHDPSFVNITTKNSINEVPKRTPSNKTIKNDSNNPKKPMIRRTISMTSVKNSPSSYKVNKANNASIIASHSTFFLDPQPPKGSLMNGRFSENPQQLSNFDSTPRTLSRDNSSKSLFSLLSHDDTDKDNLVIHDQEMIHGLSKWHDNDENENIHQMDGGTVTFELGSSDDDEN